jgi:hypothetical protein
VYETVARGEVALLNEGENKTVTAVRAPKGDRLTCMGSHNGARGLVLFEDKHVMTLLRSAWWFDETAGFKPPGLPQGRCYFVTFREMLAPTSMHEFIELKKMNTWAVQPSNVRILSPVTAAEETMCIQSESEGEGENGFKKKKPRKKL